MLTFPDSEAKIIPHVFVPDEFSILPGWDMGRGVRRRSSLDEIPVPPCQGGHCLVAHTLS